MTNTTTTTSTTSAAELRATAFVAAHSDDDEIDAEELRQAFLDMYGRDPDQDDYDAGLWSLLCAGATA